MNNRLVGNLALVAALAVLLMTFSYTWARPATTALDQIDLLIDLRHELATEYVDEPDQQKMIEGAIDGMVGSLDDPYTQYFPQEELTAFEESVRGEFTGIGAEVTIENNRLSIVTPLEDSPAYEAGVMAGDTVLSIEGTDTLNLEINEAVKMLKGPAGTDVTIRVRHESGEEIDLTITRAKIEVKSVRGFSRSTDHQFKYFLDPQAKIGYVRLNQFSEHSVEEITEAFKQLKKEGVKALILDLRFNPGGLLDAAVKISDMFLEDGQTIVSVRGRVVPEKIFKATSDTLLGDLPVVVLANPFSASAAEIVAGALADNNRALFVGERTFGKGSVQQVKMLDGGAGAIKITNAYYYLPSGRNIHRRTHQDKWGVDPSEGAYVPMNAEERRAMIEARRSRDVINAGNGQSSDEAITPDYLRSEFKDTQLAAALEAAQGYLKTGSWPTVGESNADALVMAAERDTLSRQRELLEETLAEITTKLAELEAKGHATPPASDDPAAGTIEMPDGDGSIDVEGVETVKPEAESKSEPMSDTPAPSDAPEVPGAGVPGAGADIPGGP